MAELFKFRCYQCQKLIGAPPSRFGKVVKCPKCGVDLIVPSPEGESSPEVVEEDDPDAFRPEDLGLRIEPEPILKPSVAPEPLPTVGPDPVAFLNQMEAEEEPPDSESAETPPEGPAPEIPEAIVEPLVSRPRTHRPAEPGGPTTRARDVVIPRTAAVAWSLFGLLGLAFAFLSGLLIGQRLGK